MSVKASYQQIREQLINLSVDLEDKTKVCKILVHKSRDERHLLGLVESEYESKYQLIIEVRVSDTIDNRRLQIPCSGLLEHLKCDNTNIYP